MINGVYVDKDGDFSYKNGEYEAGVDSSDMSMPGLNIARVLCKRGCALNTDYMRSMIKNYNAKPYLPLEFLM